MAAVPGLAYPEEDVLGGVEACCVDPSRVRRVPLADDAAGEAGDGALDRLGVSLDLTAGHRVRHHEVDGVLRRTPDLQLHTNTHTHTYSIRFMFMYFTVCVSAFRLDVM